MDDGLYAGLRPIARVVGPKDSVETQLGRGRSSRLGEVAIGWAEPFGFCAKAHQELLAFIHIGALFIRAELGVLLVFVTMMGSVNERTRDDVL